MTFDLKYYNILTNPKHILFIFSPLILGLTTGYFYKPGSEYQKLEKPSFIPDSIIFQIVWPILYLILGISIYIAIYKKEYKYWIIPVIHLILNLSFTPIMFGLNDIYLAYIIILLTLFTCILMMIEFFIIDNTKNSFYLLIPYLIWLIFATYLSYNIYIMNY
jgi:benzodiazapine receptor